MYHQSGYGRFGPGGGSIPEFVMRTGSITPFNPMDARHDIREKNVENAVRIPVGYPPGVAEYGPPPLPPMKGSLAGYDAFGRARREFPVPGKPTQAQAVRATEALKKTAAYIRSKGLPAAVPALVGGPLASLARGEAIILRWTNGVAITAAL